MNLDALKEMLSDVPDGGEFDLDAIIAEVSGGAPAVPRQSERPAPAPAPEPRRTASAPEPRRAASAPAPASEPRRKAPVQEQRKVQAVRWEEQVKHFPDPAAFEDEPDEAASDPRLARIAAREAKAAERRKRAADREARRAARQAGREAHEEEDYDDAPSAMAEDMEWNASTHAPRAHMTRKEARAARIAAAQAEEEEEIKLRDPAQAAKECKRRARSLSTRATIVLILAVAAAYLSLAPGIDALPLPIVLDAVENPAMGIGALMLLQFIALFVGVDVFGMGFYSLLHGMPDRSSLASFAVLAALLHGASIIVFDNQAGVNIPYLAVTILLLYAAMREERGRCAAQARGYQSICSAERPVAVYSHYDAENDACRAVKGPLFDNKDFLIEMERPDTADRFSMIYVPIALAASIILALVASVGCGEPARFFWAFSALLSVSAPLGLLCASGASYKNTSRRLLALGAAIAGARQANLLRGTEEVVLAEDDLFPPGSISLESLQNIGRLSDDRILACAAAVADAAGLELGRVLTEVARERYGVTVSARKVQMVEGGVAGQIGTSRVVLGTAALMVKMGVRIHAGRGTQTCAYLVVDDALAGVLTLRYQPTKHTYQAMRLMRRMHMSALLAVRDFNISPAMVEAEFDLRRGFADQPDPAEVSRLLDPNYAAGDAPAAMLTRQGAGPYMQVLRSADKLAGAVRASLTLGTFAGVCGMLIVFYLVFQNAVDALPVVNLLLYLLLWYAPVFIITLQTH